MELEHGSESSLRSELYPEVINWSGTSDHDFESYPKLRVRAASSDHLIVHQGIIDGSKRLVLSETHPEVIDEIVSSELSASQPDASANEGDQVMPTIKLDSSDSFSLPSSSTSSLGDPIIQLSKTESFYPRAYGTPTENPNDDAQPALEHHETGVSNNLPISEEFKNGSPGHIPRAPVSGITSESLMHRMSPTELPSVQVMERTSGYDPFRIPPSVFENPTTQVDWSIASNESLFSIHVGNNSFSRDHVFFMGDPFKSGELTKSDELFIFSPPPPIAVVSTHNQSSVPLPETNNQAFEIEKAKVTGVVDNIIEDASTAVTEDESEKDRPAAAISWKSSRASKHSDGSGYSKHSFSFPIREKCSAWPSCYCSNCSWAFCYCPLPRCYFRWPTCCFSNCSWAFCYCWNCSRKGWCCHSSSTLADSLKSGSLKATVEEQHLQEQPTARVSSKSGCCHWFHCFSCFRCSCSCLRNPCPSCRGCFSCSCC